MGRNFPQGDPEKSAWDEIACAGTHDKGHDDLERKPYGTIQDEILLEESILNQNMKIDSLKKLELKNRFKKPYKNKILIVFF